MWSLSPEDKVRNLWPLLFLKSFAKAIIHELDNFFPLLNNIVAPTSTIFKKIHANKKNLTSETFKLWQNKITSLNHAAKKKHALSLGKAQNQDTKLIFWNYLLQSSWDAEAATLEEFWLVSTFKQLLFGLCVSQNQRKKIQNHTKQQFSHLFLSSFCFLSEGLSWVLKAK